MFLPPLSFHLIMAKNGIIGIKRLRNQGVKGKTLKINPRGFYNLFAELFIGRNYILYLLIFSQDT